MVLVYQEWVGGIDSTSELNQSLLDQSISSLEDVYEILSRGDKVRHIAATKMNANSSRSHSVLSIYLNMTDPEGVKKVCQLNLVDLAGENHGFDR
jgi:hypothetical protein